MFENVDHLIFKAYRIELWTVINRDYQTTSSTIITIVIHVAAILFEAICTRFVSCTILNCSITTIMNISLYVDGIPGAFPTKYMV